jgi:hypothetical protein
VAEIAQGVEGQESQKIVCFAHKILVFHFFFTFLFFSWFYMMSPSMWLLRSKCEVFNFFQEILQGPQCWSLESRPPSTKIILAHSYLQISSWDLSPICQGCHKGRFWRRITVRTSARVRVYPADGFLPSADAVKNASARTRPCVHTDKGVPSALRADAKKIKINFFW